MHLFFWITLALYTLATTLYVANVLSRSDRVLVAARWVLVVGVACHFLQIGDLCLQRLNPLADTGGMLNLTGWVLAGGLVLVGFRCRIAALGALVVPLALLLTAAGRIIMTTGEVAKRGAKGLGAIHLTSMALGVACIALATGVSVLYLYQEGALKRRRLGAINRRLPPLNTLEHLAHRLVTLGFPLFTIAVAFGVAWLTQLYGSTGFRIEYAISGAIWLIFAGLIVARSTMGWRGRRAAWATISGFLGIVVVVVIYAVRRAGG
jgi:ABC-type uncharacterized transport system permease subunit